MLQQQCMVVDTLLMCNKYILSIHFGQYQTEAYWHCKSRTTWQFVDPVIDISLQKVWRQSKRPTSWQYVDHVLEAQGGKLKGALIAFAQHIESYISIPHRFARSVPHIPSQNLQRTHRCIFVTARPEQFLFNGLASSHCISNAIVSILQFWS